MQSLRSKGCCCFACTVRSQGLEFELKRRLNWVQIVAEVVGNEGMFGEWKGEMEMMAGRIKVRWHWHGHGHGHWSV